MQKKKTLLGEKFPIKGKWNLCQKRTGEGGGKENTAQYSGGGVEKKKGSESDTSGDERQCMEMVREAVNKTEQRKSRKKKKEEDENKGGEKNFRKGSKEDPSRTIGLHFRKPLGGESRCMGMMDDASARN